MNPIGSMLSSFDLDVGEIGTKRADVAVYDT